MRNTRIINSNVSRTIYVAKAFAIFLVIFAHCVQNGCEAVTRIYNCLGTFGVPLFFFLSGLTMNYKDNIGTFWSKKLKRVIIPWLVWGMLTYLIHIYSDNLHFDLLLFTRWIMGNGSWLYFCPALLLCFAMFRLIKSRTWAFALIAVGLLSNVLTIVGVINLGELFTNYQNPLSWIPFFGIGILMKYVDIERLLNCKIIYKIIVWVITVLTLIVYCILFPNAKYAISYWSPLSIPVELFAGLSILFISYQIRNSIIMNSTGKNTYFIYFVHMQFGVSVLNLLSRIVAIMPETTQSYVYLLLYIIKPLAVLVISYTILWIAKRVLSTLKLERFYFIFGIAN